MQCEYVQSRILCRCCGLEDPYWSWLDDNSFSHMMPSPCCTGWLAQSGHLWTCWTWCQLHVFNVSLIFVPQVLEYFVWVWWVVYLYVLYVFLCSVLVQDNVRCVDCLSEIFWRITKVLGGALLPATRTLEFSLSTYGYHWLPICIFPRCILAITQLFF